MADAHARRNNREIRKGILSPFKKFVAFTVTLIFIFYVFFISIVRSEKINLYGMIDNEIHRHFRVYFRAIFSLPNGLRPNCGKIYHGGNTGKILHQYSGRLKRHRGIATFRIPMYQIFDMFLGDLKTVIISQSVF